MTNAGENCSIDGSITTKDNDDMDVGFELQMLTHHFQSEDFIRLWGHAERLGWKYNITKLSYHAPIETGLEAFATAEEVEKFLDLPSLAEIHSNLQSIATPVESDHKIKLAQQLRRDLLTEIRRKNMGKRAKKNYGEVSNGKNDNDEDDEEEDCSENSGNYQQGTDNRGPRRRSTRLEKTSIANNCSITALEKGTDLYLHRKSRNKKKGAQKPVDTEKHTAIAQKMTIDECISLTETMLEQDEKEKTSVLSGDEIYKKDFSEWRFLLSTNHSLLFYGSGSKRKLLTEFAREELSKEGHTLLIDGFDDQVTMEDIFDLLVQLFLDGEEPSHLSAVPKHDDENVAGLGRSTPYRSHHLVERGIVIGRAIAHAIVNADCAEISMGDEQESIRALLPVFLVIHNLDAPALAESIAQEALAAMLVNSAVSNHVASVRLVASVDHIDAPMHLWSIPTSANYSWIYKPVHTFRPYTLELGLLAEEERKRGKTSNLVFQSLEAVQAGRVLDVLRNLAPRHAEVVQILARIQLEEKERWVSFSTYWTHCKNACAVSKDSQLRSLLAELNDHRLVVNKIKGSTEYVQIPYDDKKLQEIIEYERNHQG